MVLACNPDPLHVWGLLPIGAPVRPGPWLALLVGSAALPLSRFSEYVVWVHGSRSCRLDSG